MLDLPRRRTARIERVCECALEDGGVAKHPMRKRVERLESRLYACVLGSMRIE